MPNTEQVNELVAKLSYFAQEYGVNSLFVAGDFCLNMYLGLPQNLDKIEVCIADNNQVMQLASLFATEINETAIHSNKENNSATIPGDVSIEFQGSSTNSYMYNQEVQNWFQKENIEQVPITHNLYGRDFTVNALLYSLYTEKAYDQTNLAEKDIKDRRLISLLPPRMLVKYKPTVILDAISFSLSRKFHIDPELRSAMKAGHYLLPQYLSSDRIISAIVGILKIDGEEGLKMIQDYNLGEYLLIPEIKNYLGEEND